MARLLGPRAASLRAEFPPRFVLERDDVERVLREAPVDLLVVIDKGTSEKIDRIVELVPEIVVIDHHPKMGEIRRATWYNPCAELQRPYVSASMLCHMIARALGETSAADDFDAVVGLKADWAIDPTCGNDGAADYVEPFVRHARAVFPDLFGITPGATLFDFRQREESSVLSKIAELYFALTGGGGQYFFDHEDLAGIHQPRLAFESSLGLRGEISRIGSIDDFLALVPRPGPVRACLQEYRRAWEFARGKIESMRLFLEIGDTAVYVFRTEELPLMPMVGSVAIGERIRLDGKANGVIVMIAHGESGSHVSLRATGGEIDVGRICAELERRLTARIGATPGISGGGHPNAGDCRTDARVVSNEETETELMRIIGELPLAELRVAEPADVRQEAFTGRHA